MASSKKHKKLIVSKFAEKSGQTCLAARSILPSENDCFESTLIDATDFGVSVLESYDVDGTSDKWGIDTFKKHSIIEINNEKISNYFLKKKHRKLFQKTYKFKSFTVGVETKGDEVSVIESDVVVEF